MWIYEVSPIAKIPSNSLTYFSKEDFLIGDIIFVDLRNKKEKAIVLFREKIEDIRSYLKDKDFKIKKIEPQIKIGQLDKDLLGFLQNISLKYLCPIGYLFKIFFLEESFQNFVNIGKKPSEPKLNTSESFLQENSAEKSIVFFANDRQAKIFFDENKIANKRVLLITEKEIKNFLEKDLKVSQNIQIISSVKFLFYFICLEDFFFYFDAFHSQSYLDNFHFPYLDFREVILTFLDRFFLEKVYLQNDFEPSILFERFSNQNQISGFSKSLSTFILEKQEDKQKYIKSLKNTKNIFFVLKKSIAYNHFCSDCALPLLCKNCDNILELVKRNKKAEKDFKKEDFEPFLEGEEVLDSQRSFFCKYCNFFYDSKVFCTKCQSYNIQSLGLGVLGYKELLESLGREVFVLDQPGAKDLKKAKTILENFEKSKNKKALILNQYSLDFIEKEYFEKIIVLDIDPLVFRSGVFVLESILDLLQKIKKVSKAQKIVLKKDSSFLKSILENPEVILWQEFEMAKTFFKPPYWWTYKLQIEASNKKILEKNSKTIFEKLNLLADKSIKLEITEPHISKIKNKYLKNIVIKLPKKEFESKNIKNHTKILLNLANLYLNFKFDVKINKDDIYI